MVILYYVNICLLIWLQLVVTVLRDRSGVNEVTNITRLCVETTGH